MRSKCCLFLVFALLLVMGSACGSIYSPKETSGIAADPEPDTEQEPKEVYYTVGMHIILPYWQDHRYGLEAAAEELGVEVVFTGESGNNALRQVDIFEQVVAEKPAGILVSPIDKQAMVEPINRAIAQGIPVVCIDTDAPESNRLTYFGTNNYKSGYKAGEIIGNRLAGKGDVGILTIPGIYSLNERQRGFEECLEEKFPDINVVAVMNDEADPSKATNIAAQMFEDFPSIVGLFCTDAAGGVGAAIALSENQKLGQIIVVAFDKDAEVLELVEQGKIAATLVQRTFTMSYYGLKFLYDYNHNRRLKHDGKTSLLPDVVDTGFIVVTKENVGSFK